MTIRFASPRLSTLACLVGLLAPLSVFASPSAIPPSNSTIPPSIEAVNHLLSLDVGAQSMNFREYDTQGLTGNGLLDKEVGVQPSVQIGYTNAFNALGVQHWLFRFSSTLAHGHANYSGYNQAVSPQGVVLTPVRANASDSTYVFSASLGKTFAVGSRVALTPYVAYSYERWARTIQQSIGNTGENYQHHVVGAGLLTQIALGSRWVASLDASLGESLANHVQTGVGNLHPSSRPEERLSLGVDYALSPRWHLNALYALQHATYGQSPVHNGYFEPPSHSTNQQVMVGLGYRF